jgi:hypothetical protein
MDADFRTQDSSLISRSKMMPTHKALSTSTALLTADHRKGQKFVEVCRAAYNKAGLDDERGQFLNENKAFSAALSQLIDEYSMPIKAPHGGRLHVLRVPVDPGREWQEAINVAGPDTGSNWDVRKVCDKYPPKSGELKEREIILVNFGKTILSSRYALDWANSYGMRPEDPCGIFAIGEHKPQLHRELNIDAMAVISLEACSFEGEQHVCGVWWSASERLASLGWFGRGWDTNFWFAFSRE